MIYQAIHNSLILNDKFANSENLCLNDEIFKCPIDDQIDGMNIVVQEILLVSAAAFLCRSMTGADDPLSSACNRDR